MSQDYQIDTHLRRVTKSEACQLLQVSLSTLNRRIAEGQLAVERGRQGQVQRPGPPPGRPRLRASQ